MKKILFLSSALVMGMCSAFADDTTTAPDKKITGGAGTCTVDVLGVSDNNATANTIATWSLNSYDCAAGQYLDETTLNCTECPVGSYCPGGAFTVEANNSKTACPTDYTSDTAATAESECYMGCELACSTNAACPAHSNNCTHSAFKTTGRQYVDATCNAYPSVCPVADFACDTGYTKTVLADIPLFVEKINDIVNSSSSLTIQECGLDGEDSTVEGSAMGDNGVNDCETLKPGQGTINIGEYVYFIEASANDYGLDTPGVVTKKYLLDKMTGMEIYEQLNYLPNADFVPGGSGDNLWLRVSKVGKFGPSMMSFLMLMYGERSEEVMFSLLPADVLAATSGLQSSDTIQQFANLIERARSGDVDSKDKLSSELSKIAESANAEDAEFLEELITDIDFLYEIISLHKTLSGMLHPKTIEALSKFAALQAMGGTEEEIATANAEAEKALMQYEIIFMETNMPWINGGVPDAFVLGFVFLIMGFDSTIGNVLTLIEPQITASYCANNTININWNPDNGSTPIQNMCYYDYSVDVPSDPVKPGYTFMGWKLLENTTTE